MCVCVCVCVRRWVRVCVCVCVCVCCLFVTLHLTRSESSGTPWYVIRVHALLNPGTHRKPMQERYSFTCRCPRCSFEASLPEETGQFVLQAYSELAMMQEV